MAEWGKNKVESSQINNGKEYEAKDRISREQLNAIVNNSFYASDKAKEAIDIANDLQGVVGSPVSYAPQNLTQEQQAQARTNIGAFSQEDGDTKVDKVIGATENNFAGLDANGNIIDSNSKAGDFLNLNQISACILKAPNGVATYTSKSVIIKSGLELLIPNGRNADGTLNNYHVTLTEDITFDSSSMGSNTRWFGVSMGGIDTEGLTYVWGVYNLGNLAEPPTSISKRVERYFNTKENKWYLSNSGRTTWEETYPCVILGYVTTSSGTVTSLELNKPINLPTQETINTISMLPSDKRIDTTVTAGGFTEAPVSGYFVLQTSGTYQSIMTSNTGDTTSYILRSRSTRETSGALRDTLPIKKGQYVFTEFGGTLAAAYFVPAEEV